MKDDGRSMGEALDLDEGRGGTHAVGRDRGSITGLAVKPKAKLVALAKEYYKDGTYGNIIPVKGR